MAKTDSIASLWYQTNREVERGNFERKGDRIIGLQMETGDERGREAMTGREGQRRETDWRAREKGSRLLSGLERIRIF